jgi:electron transfer flavoprotein alpha subunit
MMSSSLLSALRSLLFFSFFCYRRRVDVNMIPLARQSVLRALRSQSSLRSLTSSQSSQLSRLLSTLAILEQREGNLNTGSLGAITAGKKLGGAVHGFVAGKSAKSIADNASKIDGLEKVIAVENEAYERGLPENWAPLLVENIKKGGYTHVIASHSSFGKSLLPRVAALLDVQQISDVMSIEGEDSMSGLQSINSEQSADTG